MIDFEELAKQHAKLFPLADFDSQMAKLDEEIDEFKNANTTVQQIKELADCTICIIGIYRFAPDIANLIYSGLLDLYILEPEQKIAIESEVNRKWQVNLSRKWEWNGRVYKHVGKDGNE